MAGKLIGSLTSIFLMMMISLAVLFNSGTGYNHSSRITEILQIGGIGWLNPVLESFASFSPLEEQREERIPKNFDLHI